MLAARAEALNALLRADLALGRLLWRSVQTVALAFGAFVLMGAWIDLTSERDERFVDGELVLVGGGTFVVTAALLCVGLARQRRTTRLLYDWARVLDRTWSLAPGASHPLPGQTVPARDPRAWEATVEAVRQWRGARQTLGGAGSALVPDSFARARVVWGVAGSGAFVVAALNVGLAMAGAYDGALSAERESELVVNMAALGSVVLAVAGGLALHRSLRLVSQVKQVRRRPDRRSGGKSTELPDLLAGVTPGSAFDRRHRAMPSSLLALIVGLVAAAVSLLGAGSLGQAGAVTSAPLILLLAVALAGYCRQVWLPVLALSAGMFLFIVGATVDDTEILEERGEWVRGTVVSNERPWGQNRRECVVEYPTDRSPDTVRCHDTDEVGREVRVRIDPEGEVGPTLSSPSSSGNTVVTTVMGALFTGAVTVGTFTGHRNRRRLGADGQRASGQSRDSASP